MENIKMKTIKLKVSTKIINNFPPKKWNLHHKNKIFNELLIINIILIINLNIKNNKISLNKSTFHQQFNQFNNLIIKNKNFNQEIFPNI